MAKRKWTATEKKAFAEKMKKARAAKARKSKAPKKRAPAKRKAPAKKRVVKKRSTPMTTPKYRIVVLNRKSRGYWTGKVFDTEFQKARKYSSLISAKKVAENMSIPTGWKLGVEKFSVKKL